MHGVGDAEVVEVVAAQLATLAGGLDAGDEAVDHRGVLEDVAARCRRAARTKSRRVAIGGGDDVVAAGEGGVEGGGELGEGLGVAAGLAEQAAAAQADLGAERGVV
jgi:hypothetical protein